MNKIMKNIILVFVLLISVSLVFAITGHPANQISDGIFSGSYQVADGGIIIEDRGDGYADFRLQTMNPSWHMYVENTTGKFRLFQHKDVSGATVAENRIVVDNSGNVGIGVEDPGARLHVEQPDGATYAFKLSRTGGLGNWFTFLGTNGKLNWLDNTATRITFENGTGNVGIGVSDPDHLLDVNGNINANSVMEIRNAANFPGEDIGAKINAAIADFPSEQVGTVIVSPSVWSGKNYSTQILVNRPVHLIFPGMRAGLGAH